MGNRLTVIEAQEMVPRGDSRLSNAPLVPTEEHFRPHTTPVPQIKVSCHLITDSFILDSSHSFAFTFDTLSDCCITISPKISTSEALCPSNFRRTFTFPPGINQLFTGWQLDFENKSDSSFENRAKEIHVKIECKVPVQHSETSTILFTKVGEDYQSKVKLQTLEYKEKHYVLHEIFGNVQEDRLECAICLFNKRDTVIIPCYHMCLCSSCGNMLRAQASKKCPMCRCGNIYIEAEALIKINQD